MSRRMKKKSQRRNDRIVVAEEPWLKALKDYTPTMSCRVVRRYIMNATGTPSVNSLALIIAGGCCVTVANSSGRSICFAAKIHRLRIWAQPITSSTAAYGVPTTVTLTWGPIPPTNVFYGANRSQVTATAIGPEEPAFIDSRPPRGSNAAGWQMGNTDQLFVISGGGNSAGGLTTGVPAGTIVELDATYIISDGSTLGAPMPTITSAASLGSIVYPSLDNQGFKWLTAQGITTCV